MSSLRITRRRTTQLVWTTILTLSCVIVFIDVDGLKAKPLEYECLNGAWTNDGTPFEEPELNADATCLSNHDHRSHECEPQAAVQAGEGNDTLSAPHAHRQLPVPSRLDALIEP